jgi:hypothetical protein
VPPHHLHDQRAVVRLGRGVQAVDRLRGDADRGVEAEGVVGGAQVVVDGLGDADDVQPLGGQPGRDPEGVLAADGHQRVDAQVGQVAPHLLDAVVHLHHVGARAAEDRAAARQDAARRLDVERHGDLLQRPPPAVAEPEELVAVHLDALADDGADDRVEAGAVATAGEDADAHAGAPPGRAPADGDGFAATVVGRGLQPRSSCADDVVVHPALRLVAPLALAAAALLAVPTSGAAATGPAPDLARLQADLERVTAQTATLAEALEVAAARDSGLRVELSRLAEQQDAARSRVDTRARQAYLAVQARRADPMARLVGGLAAPDLRKMADAELARRGAVSAVRSESALADAVGEHSAAATRLQEQAVAYRAELAVQAEQALSAQETARALLAQAERALAEQEAAAAQARQRASAAQAARQQAARQASALAAARSALDSSRTRLDASSAAVTKALTPAQTKRSLNAAVREAPVVALVEAAGAGYPAGYRPTGQVQRGGASWYGPGLRRQPDGERRALRPRAAHLRAQDAAAGHGRPGHPRPARGQLPGERPRPLRRRPHHRHVACRLAGARLRRRGRRRGGGPGAVHLRCRARYSAGRAFAFPTGWNGPRGVPTWASPTGGATCAG